jgi:peroxiredoxin
VAFNAQNITTSIIEEINMGEKLQQGDRFPSLTLKLVQGDTIRLPDEMPTRYAAVLFYRGHW